MEALRLDMDFDLLRDFAQEALDTLDQIEPGLVRLSEPAPDSAGDPEFVHQVFRAFHSMKGSAGFMNLTTVQRLTHESETLLDGARGGQAPLTPARVVLLLETADLLRGLLEHVAAEGHDRFSQVEVETLVRRLRAALDPRFGSGAAPAVPRLTPVPPAPDGAQPAPAEPVPAPAPSPPTPQLAGKSPAAESPEPPAALATEHAREAARAALGRACARLERAGGQAPSGEDRAALAEALRALAGHAQAAALAEAARMAGRLALLAERGDSGSGLIASVLEVLGDALSEGGPEPALDALFDLVEEALPADAGIEPIGAAEPPQETPEQPPAPPEAVAADGPAGAMVSSPAPAEPAPPAAPKSAAASTAPPGGPARASIRVDAERLDGLVDLVGELIIAGSMLARFGAPAPREQEGYEAATAQLAKITRDLQDLSMSLRMVPAATVFQKMARLVREIAAKLGKDAELVLQGEETEVDKTVIEQLSDPLVHMLRNALDHGLEPPEERRRAGKPPRGRIVLQARQEGDEVRITVRDDGRGLDPERLLRKGIERGLVRGGGAGMSREQIFRLIFEPGFSTAEHVTDVSGRGVGMDVVKRNVEKLKGRIEIASQPGQGTAFTVRLPLTLAIIEGMRVRVGDSQYAIPMAAIREAVRVAPEAVTRTAEGQELALIRERLYPVLRLHEAHGITPDHGEPWEGLLVLLEHPEFPFALLVDELLGHQQTVVKGLAAYLGAVPGVSGCSILGDGDVSLILDVSDLAGWTRDGADSPRRKMPAAFLER